MYREPSGNDLRRARVRHLRESIENGTYPLDDLLGRERTIARLHRDVMASPVDPSDSLADAMADELAGELACDRRVFGARLCCECGHEREIDAAARCRACAECHATALATVAGGQGRSADDVYDGGRCLAYLFIYGCVILAGAAIVWSIS